MFKQDKEIVIATRNPDKWLELQKILKGLKIGVISLQRYPGCPQAREGNTSFKINAVRKAMAVSKFTGKLALADDSGLEVDALGGEPGVCSARFAGKNVTYAQNNQKLLNLLKGKEAKQRGAQFRCVVAVCRYPQIIAVVEGRIRGKITLQPQGRHGFGYDPVFLIPRYKKTFAQLGPVIKNKFSHRARALKKAKKIILKYFNLHP